MGRPLKIKKSTTKDIGFNPYNLLDQATVVIPGTLTSSQFTGVVGGAETGVATTAYPVVAITAFLQGGAEANAYIITQKGQTKYLVAVETSINAGSFVVGQSYVITSVGTTNWKQIGGTTATPAVGDVFTATGVGAGTGTAYQVGVCSLVNVASGSLTAGQMQMTVDYQSGTPVQVSRITNKYVWDYSTPPVKYLANFFDNGGDTAAASGADVATWANGTGLYTLGEVSNYTS
jgi:hypothetical protein